MKDQYFGDVNDFRKYGLLRLLTVTDHLRLGVCWMLTDADGRSDGKFRSYLNQPASYRHHDPELFDWIKRVVAEEQDYRTARIETSPLIGHTVFQSTILTDDLAQRNEYFCECATLFAGCDLVFFDPDNGLEIKKKRPGHKNSCKFLFWDEACKTFMSGSSVLIYQHFPRQKRDPFIARTAEDLRLRTGAATVFSYRTPHVLFLLAALTKATAGEFAQETGHRRGMTASPRKMYGGRSRRGESGRKYVNRSCRLAEANGNSREQVSAWSLCQAHSRQR